jgi:hypothetical protein
VSPDDKTPPPVKESPVDFINRRMRELQEEQRRKQKPTEGNKDTDDRPD